MSSSKFFLILGACIFICQAPNARAEKCNVDLVISDAKLSQVEAESLGQVIESKRYVIDHQFFNQDDQAFEKWKSGEKGYRTISLGTYHGGGEDPTVLTQALLENRIKLPCSPDGDPQHFCEMDANIPAQTTLMLFHTHFSRYLKLLKQLPECKYDQ